MQETWFSFPDIGPVAISLGPLVVRWYALAYVLGIVFGFFYMKRLVANARLWGGRAPGITAEQLDDLFLYGVLGVIIGGRAGYVLFYDLPMFLANPLEIFAVWHGGMSFHGGFLGVIIGAWIFARKNNVRLDRLLDLGGAAVPIGLGLGRLANFVNGELYGRISDVPWAIVFPDGGPFPRHPSQLYEAVLEGLILFGVAFFATHKLNALQRPGLTAGIFATGYSASRIIVEFFREPDVQIGYIFGFITMGMVLSLPLLAVGVWLIGRGLKMKVA
jgi:phosphatidylglycerol---prolipoprotein diacylglyceryl transferase